MDARQSPNKVPWPPLLLACALALGIGANTVFYAPLFGGSIARYTGASVIVAALALDATAIVTLMRHDTNVLPHSASTALVTSGPFALSRNPIYLGNVLLTVGLAFALANAWLLAAAAIEAALVRKLAIDREERHLEARFGREWLAYCARTPRWFGALHQRQ